MRSCKAKSLGIVSQWLREKLLPVLKSPHVHFDLGWDACRRHFFSVIFVSLVFSKLLHIYAHAYYLTLHSFLVWASTFFLQEVLLILIARALTRSFQWRTSRIVAALVTVPFSIYVSLMASANTSFYVVVGREIHWGPSKGFFGDMLPPTTILFFVLGIIIIEISIMLASYFVTPYAYQYTGSFARIWSSSMSALFRCCFCRRREKQTLPDPSVYEQIALDDHEDDKSDVESVLLSDPRSPKTPRKKKSSSFMKRFVIVFASSIVIVLRCFRPPELAYRVLSDSLVNAPFITDHGHRPIFEGLAYLPGDFSWLRNRTALDTPRKFDWLSSDEPLAGFEDWYPFTLNEKNERVPKDHPLLHYNPEKDPLHIPNLQNDVLEPLREGLRNGGVNFKHVILVKLESNRQDVFPLRANSYLMERVKQSYEHGRIPKETEDRLSRLTPTAEHLSGLATGFNKDRVKPYGGISATNHYTAGSFTLKSMTGTICGMNPLAIDMNREFLYDFYQPCLPRMFDVLNRLGNVTSETDDWTSWPWHTTWMQSVSGEYDFQSRLMPVLGYHDVMTQESIDANGGEHAPDPSQSVPYRGHMDKVLKPYMRDALADAEKKHTRLFLSHLTGATHVPWTVPGHTYEQLLGNSGELLHDNLNRLLNSIIYQDEWLADVLEILRDVGVADETLIVLVGDHGVSLPNDEGYTPHDSPHEANEHVPLVFAHPKLPPIELKDKTHSTQILPTILDLLLETSSVNADSQKILKDLLPMYGGQSIIRPLIPEQDRKQEWHITTMNTGGSYISMQSAVKPYRVVVPLVTNAKWRFSDLASDPFELHPVTDYDVLSLVYTVQSRYGSEAAHWLAEAAHVAQWWIPENYRRWGYNPDAPKGL